MSDHPYSRYPDRAFWRRSVAGVAPSSIDPVADVRFTIGRDDAIVTAGSCFAQHIARHLAKRGFRYLVTEPPHPIVSEEVARTFNYGVFSARYGNVYTARQMMQLFERAYGRFTPVDDCWVEPNGRFLDPFRPQIQPKGFATKLEFEVDRRRHLAATRLAFESAKVMVFTLGLTEAWRHREDGAVYPVCPGVSGGRFDPEQHEFHNHTVTETTEDTLAFIRALRSVNPEVKVVLTVSPVPLVATASDEHVLTATTYSKAVLRVAASTVAETLPGVAYFPSYEIITGPHARGAYFADDLRSVTEVGVEHVMGVFLRRFTEEAVEAHVEGNGTPGLSGQSHLERMQAAVEANCDEVALDRS